MSLPKVLFIGLGMMGRPMATHIAKAGYPLIVSDMNEVTVAELCNEVGASDLKSADTISDVGIVITMLPNSAIVRDVLVGKQRIAAQVKKGAVVIDMSSSEPLQTRELAAELEALSIGLLDAPVSGGVKRAVSGTLAIMVGGTAELAAQYDALLTKMGKTTHVGPVGAGHAIKALNNYVSAAGLLAAVEALHVGEKFGLDPAVMTDVLNSASGSNNATLNKVHQFMLNGTYASGFALQLMVKDLKIAVALAEQMGEDMKLGHECLEVWMDAAEESNPRTDHTEMYRIVGHHG
ncbi:3-hydroxyisobutyrate dehydrogenase [Pseudomonas sp. JV551A1]|uniref:NAD(P)-dependent oxidoreductase n=1 Tax=Pseudomonas sp. JV551A1 TaxID=2078787 RepID=UPI00100CE429|nr:NAD(P)-dependent oxidoreductase [Pseudomonas sp. JV551A1]SPO55716.1 3-hydroxyisobutyrate dehydrogenase [Pseudomonas sp. JV551A1]